MESNGNAARIQPCSCYLFLKGCQALTGHLNAMLDILKLNADSAFDERLKSLGIAGLNGYLLQHIVLLAGTIGFTLVILEKSTNWQGN